MNFMGDRFTTSVKIGGPLDEPRLREIISSAVVDGFSIEWEGTDKEDYILAKCIAALRAGETHLEFNDPEISNDSLESFTGELTRLGVPWNASIDAKFEFDGEFRWWRPGMKVCYESSPANCDCTDSVATLGMLLQWRRQKKSLSDIIKQLRNTPPKLPKIKWTNTPTHSEKGG